VELTEGDKESVKKNKKYEPGFGIDFEFKAFMSRSSWECSFIAQSYVINDIVCVRSATTNFPLFKR
jgi:hypothetical protein